MNKSSIKGLIGLFVILVITAVAIIYSSYNKPHRSVMAEDATQVTASQLATDYGLNEEAANKKYLDKAIDVTGIVAEITSNQQGKPVVTFQGTDMVGVQCTLLADPGKIKSGDKVRAKGFCTGFLTDVIIDRGVVQR